MCPPAPDSSSTRRLARYTPDSRRWRYALAGLSAVAAPVLFYYTTRLISSTWSGTLPSLLVLVGSVLTLVTAALGPTLLLAPDGGAQRDDRRRESAIDDLKRRYAAGEVSDAEFERRLETLMRTPSDERRRPPESGTEPGTERMAVDIESEID